MVIPYPYTHWRIARHQRGFSTLDDVDEAGTLVLPVEANSRLVQCSISPAKAYRPCICGFRATRTLALERQWTASVLSEAFPLSSWEGQAVINQSVPRIEIAFLLHRVLIILMSCLSQKPTTGRRL